MTVANQVHQAALALKERSSRDFVDTVIKLGIRDNMQSPYAGASARTYDKLDVEAAGSYLEHKLGVDPGSFSRACHQYQPADG